MFTNPAACDIFAFTGVGLWDSFPQDYCRSLGGSASVCVTLLSVSPSEKELQKKQRGEERNILHFLESFDQCYTTNLPAFKRWSLECSHSGCQGRESWSHLGQKRPLRSSDHVFYRLINEWVWQKPQTHTWPTLCQPQMPHTDTRTNTPHTRNVDVCENSNFIYRITREICLENKRVSPEAFWLLCLELLPLESHCRKRGTTHCHRHWICSPLETEPACRTPSPRDSKPLSCYLVAKGIVSRTLTVLCTKYRGILIRYHKLHP